MKRLLTLALFGFAICTLYGCSKFNAGPEPEPTSLKIGLIAHLPFDGNADGAGEGNAVGNGDGFTVGNVEGAGDGCDVG